MGLQGRQEQDMFKKKSKTNETILILFYFQGAINIY